MKFMKLVLIGVLAGTLGLVGCDSDSGGEAGSGGTAGTGGTAGSGGSTGGTGGGTGGTGGGGDPMACGAGESVDESYTTDEGSVDCDALGVITVPITIVLAAQADSVDGETDVNVQAQIIISEETVGDLGALVQTALIGEASADVADSEGDGTVNVAATVPCTVDFTDDPDDNDTPGPITVTTPVTTAVWTAIDGSIVVEAVDLTFQITQPVPLPLSTKGENPACTWVDMPSVTLPAI